MSKPKIDRRCALQALAVGGVATALYSPSPAIHAADVDVMKVPAAVKDAANRVLKGVKWSTAHKSKGIYELEGKDAKDHEVSVEVTTGGKVRGVERQIASKNVPDKVMKAATNRFPKFTSNMIHEVYHADDIRDLEKAHLSYELHGTIAKGHDVVLTIETDGSIHTIKVQVDLKSVPKTVTDALMAAEPKFKAASVYKLEEDGKTVGYLFSGDFRKDKKEVVAFVSADGKTVEVHTDDA